MIVPAKINSRNVGAYISSALSNGYIVDATISSVTVTPKTVYVVTLYLNEPFTGAYYSDDDNQDCDYFYVSGSARSLCTSRDSTRPREFKSIDAAVSYLLKNSLESSFIKLNIS